MLPQHKITAMVQSSALPIALIPVFIGTFNGTPAVTEQ